jgi:hypothetical protein
MNILTVNLLFSTFVFWVAAKIYLLPRLHDLKPQAVLLPILLLHSFRHLGLMFLAPGATYAGIRRNSLILQHSVIYLRPYSHSHRFWRSPKTSEVLVFSYGFSTWSDRWTCSTRLHWQRSTEHQRTWGQPIGSLRSGFLHC